MEKILSQFTSISIFTQFLNKGNQEWVDTSINIKRLLAKLYIYQDFSDMTFYDVKFWNTEFIDLNFDNSSLFGCSFQSCSINNSSFHKAIIIDISFIDCEVINSCFQNTKIINIFFDESIMIKCDFISAHISRGCVNYKIQNNDFDYATINHVDFSHSNIEHNDFNNTLIDNCIFQASNILDTSFNDSTLLNCNFASIHNKVNMDQVTFTRTSLKGSTFIGTDVSSCTMSFIKNAIFNYSDYITLSI